MRNLINNRATRSLLASAVLLGALSSPNTALRAADQSPSTAELLQRIDALQQQLKELQAKVEQQQTVVTAVAASQSGGVSVSSGTNETRLKSTAFISAGADGFSFNSSDTNFVI